MRYHMRDRFSCYWRAEDGAATKETATIGTTGVITIRARVNMLESISQENCLKKRFDALKSKSVTKIKKNP